MINAAQTPSSSGTDSGDSFSADLASLLITRLCHDLAGPVGAVAAGCELLSEGDTDFLDETASLLTHSSAGAVIRLKVLRLALGSVGAPVPNLAEVLKTYCDVLHGTEVQLGWPEADAHMVCAGPQQRVLANAVLLALDVLPGRGSVSVSCSEAAGQPGPDDPQVCVRIDVTAPRIRFTDGVADALKGQRGGLSARTVQAFWLYCLTASRGGVEVEQSDGHMTFSIPLPRAEP